jgi:hypothetical protein
MVTYCPPVRLVNGVAGLVSSLSQGFYFFLVLRFLSGVG